MPSYVYHDPTRITRVATGTLITSCLLTVVAIPLMIAQALAFGRAINAKAADQMQAYHEVEVWMRSIEMLEGIANFVGLVFSVVFLRWTYCVARNAHALSDVPLRTTPGLAVGWYFVPIAFFWMPLVALNEIVTESRPHGNEDPVPTVTWWLASYAVTLAAAIALVVASDPTVDLETLLAVRWFTIVMGFGQLAVGLFCYLIMTRVAAMQRERYRESGTSSGGGRECDSCGEPLGVEDRVCSMCGERTERIAFASGR